MSSLYRRHRPQNFSEVVGQEHVVRTLSNAIELDRLHHAYLFVGARGTGKTSVAKILARSLNCVNGPTLEPCGECESCRSIADSTSLDVIEMDAASHNSVEDIRELRDKVAFVPTGGHWKVYILDEAHMLSTAAWNAFLKTLEEPPPRTIFVLATTEAHKVMPTIVDRCQRFDFRRPSLEQLCTVLRRVADAEQIQIPDDALVAVARSATGSFRDALGTLEQLVTFGGDKLEIDDVLGVLGITDAERVFALTETLIDSDPKAVLLAVEEMAAAGADLVRLLRDLEDHWRTLLIVKTTGEISQTFGLTEDHRRQVGAQAQRFGQQELIRALELVGDALAAIGSGADPRLQLELALVKVAQPAADRAPDALLVRIEQLERRLAQAPPVTEITEAVAEPEPDPQPTELEPAKVLASWPAILERLRNDERGHLLVALLTEARPRAVENGRLKLSYPPSAAFHKRKAEDAPIREQIATAIEAVTGHPLQPAFEISEEGEPATEPAQPELSEEEILELLKSEFDAQEIQE